MPKPTEVCQYGRAEGTCVGSSMHAMFHNGKEFQFQHVPHVRPSERHCVLYKFPISSKDNRPPKPRVKEQKWNSDYVQLPCDHSNIYEIVKNEKGDESNIRPIFSWTIIKVAHEPTFTSILDFKTAIFAYNSKYQSEWHFQGLETLLEEHLSDDERKDFFENLLPSIKRLALRLPQLVCAQIPLLQQGYPRSISLSQEQIASLLANAFLCTFPHRNSTALDSDFRSYPPINFARLFNATSPQALEKLKCILHYFRRVSEHMPNGVVTFTRRCYRTSNFPSWHKDETQISNAPFHISSEGNIEDSGIGLLQVNFANNYVGGAVFGDGCAQEEIRYVICPELLVAKLFTEVLSDKEALIITGAERYCNYTGFLDTFQFASDHVDVTPMDSSRRHMTYIVAIDAIDFSEFDNQYYMNNILRELNKAYVGFHHELDTPAPGIATGNWGCGTFGGDVTLKALIQIMACAVNKRPIAYFTYNCEMLREEIYRMFKYLVDSEQRVRDVWAMIQQYKKGSDTKALYDFIYSFQQDPKAYPSSHTLGESKSFFKLEQLPQSSPSHAAIQHQLQPSKKRL